jgi:hypothetical protein
MKKTPKKLVLDRETLRHLEKALAPEQLEQILGGNNPSFKRTCACP